MLNLIGHVLVERRVSRVERGIGSMRHPILFAWYILAEIACGPPAMPCWDLLYCHIASVPGMQCYQLYPACRALSYGVGPSSYDLTWSTGSWLGYPCSLGQTWSYIGNCLSTPPMTHLRRMLLFHSVSASDATMIFGFAILESINVMGSP